MPGAKAAAADHRDFGHHAIRYRVDHLGSGANDPAPLGFLADHEAIHVVQENQRDPVLVAVEDKPRGLVRRVGVDHATKFNPLLIGARRHRRDLLFLVGDNTHRPAANPRVPAKQSLPVLRAVFFEMAAVHHPRDNFAHVVLLAGARRKHSVDALFRIGRRFRFFVIERRTRGRRDFIRQRTQPLDAGRVIRLAEIHRSADLRVHLCAAQFFRRRFLSDRGLHQRRSGEKQPAAVRH